MEDRRVLRFGNVMLCVDHLACKARTMDAKRKAENDDLIARMKRGESLSRCAPQDTWFQPRPTIKKDQKEMARVYGGQEDGTKSRIKPV